MARLPQPGSDENIWGGLLNEFLSVSFSSEGTLKATAIASKADDTAVVHNIGNESIAGVKTFLSPPSVPVPTLGGDAASKTYVDNAVLSGMPDATTTTKGKVQLAGDLSGTADAPTVDFVNDNLHVSKTGDTMTGNLVVSGASMQVTGSGSRAILNRTDTTGTAAFDFRTADTYDWAFGMVQSSSDKLKYASRLNGDTLIMTTDNNVVVDNKLLISDNSGGMPAVTLHATVDTGTDTIGEIARFDAHNGGNSGVYATFCAGANEMGAIGGYFDGATKLGFWTGTSHALAGYFDGSQNLHILNGRSLALHNAADNSELYMYNVGASGSSKLRIDAGFYINGVLDVADTLTMQAYIYLKDQNRLRGYINETEYVELYPGFTQGAEKGWFMPQLRLTGGRFGFDAFDGKAEFRLHGAPQFNVYDVDNSRYILQIDATTRNVMLFGQINNVSDPTSSQDAATKSYVDGFVGRNMQLKVVADSEYVTTGDNKVVFCVPSNYNGLGLVEAHAFVSTISVLGDLSIQVRNITQAADMLSTAITIDAAENTSYTAAVAPVIDMAHDTVATGDLIAIDVDQAGSGAQGLGIVLRFA